jgi:cholesterol 7alpha-monooxygenase
MENLRGLLLFGYGLVGLAGIWVVLNVVRIISQRARSRPPLVGGWIPFLGCALQFGPHPMEFLKQTKQKHGDLFTLTVAGRNMYHNIVFNISGPI